MIRRMQRADIDRVANIWLDTNIRAHNFISKQYWQKIKERKYLYHKKYTLFYIIIKISPSFDNLNLWRIEIYECDNSRIGKLFT